VEHGEALVHAEPLGDARVVVEDQEGERLRGHALVIGRGART
jgi:hypothetical protein